MLKTLNGNTGRFSDKSAWLIFLFCMFVSASATAAGATVVEFYNTNLDNYFITADASEAAAIDSGSAGPGWSRTGNTFTSGGSTSVCRFYGSMSPGPNSHFYTADAGECASLKQLQATTPATEKRWNFESLDFITTLPTNGTCPTGTTPVYRAYNNGWTRGLDSNHRIASSQAAIQDVVARGWNNEGVVMCAPSSSSSGTAPGCTLTATPASISAGASSILTASCTPAATSYTWSGTCLGITSAICTVSPTSTTTYSVTGSNAAGAGYSTNATVTVTPLPTISATCTSNNLTVQNYNAITAGMTLAQVEQTLGCTHHSITASSPYYIYVWDNLATVGLDVSFYGAGKMIQVIFDGTGIVISNNEIVPGFVLLWNKHIFGTYGGVTYMQIHDGGNI